MKANGGSAQPDEQSCLHSLAFSGKITASVTHELNNVLGTIDQVNGLIEDVVEFGTSDPDTISTKLQGISDRIAKQIERGSRLIERLNSFAHMSDHGTGACDVKVLVENITALSRRLAGLRKTELRASLPDEGVTITTNPFQFAQLYFAVIYAAIGTVAAESLIDVCLSEIEDGIRIEISAQCDEFVSNITGGTEIDSLIGRLSAKIDESHDSGLKKIKMFFPQKI